MAPTIHLVRHAQGHHNLSIENEQMHDPDLTTLGETQCAALRASFPYHDRIAKLVASPMRRTLYTCMNAFATEELYPVAAVDVLQESSASPCDTGTEVRLLREEFDQAVDFTAVGGEWIDKSPSSRFEPVFTKLMARGKDARRELRKIAGGVGDGHIVVVSHGSFLHFLTDDWFGIPPGGGKYRVCMSEGLVSSCSSLA
jgi:broad specificity phosphatase PhoE